MITKYLVALSLLSFVSCGEALGGPNSSGGGEQVTPDTPTPSNSLLVDKKATENTQLLFENLMESAKKGVIFGQQESYMENKNKKYQGNCAISDITGEMPLLAGCDIENLTNDSYAVGNWRYTRVENMAEWIKECHRKGVFTTLSWHFREPFYGDSFYVTDMDKVDPNTSKAAFKSILEGGVNHTYYKKKLALLADFFKSLKDDDGELIPVIFRPFHEFGGKWFWWGVPYYATPAEFVQNWQFTVDFLKDTCGVHNLIYAFTPGFDSEAEYLESYPGDDYVDVLGFDSYTSNKVGNATNREAELKELVAQLNIISKLASERRKVAAFTEFGHQINDKSKEVKRIYTDFYLEAIKRANADIAYMMTWYNTADKQFTPIAGNEEYFDNFKSFVTSSEIFTAGEIASPLKAK